MLAKTPTATGPKGWDKASSELSKERRVVCHPFWNPQDSFQAPSSGLGVEHKYRARESWYWNGRPGREPPDVVKRWLSWHCSVYKHPSYVTNKAPSTGLCQPSMIFLVPEGFRGRCWVFVCSGLSRAHQNVITRRQMGWQILAANKELSPYRMCKLVSCTAIRNIISAWALLIFFILRNDNSKRLQLLAL